jgi:hypothetical protein
MLLARSGENAHGERRMLQYVGVRRGRYEARDPIYQTGARDWSCALLKTSGILSAPHHR